MQRRSSAPVPQAGAERVWAECGWAEATGALPGSGTTDRAVDLVFRTFISYARTCIGPDFSTGLPPADGLPKRTNPPAPGPRHARRSTRTPGHHQVW
jgi:hypothetical protein